MSTGKFHTVNGPVSTESLGLILPHEHLFTDLRGPTTPDYAQADPEDVIRALMPYLREAHLAGVTALVECSTVGVGRNIQILKEIASSTPIQIIAPTGVYREAYVPESHISLSAEEFAQRWVADLTEGIEDTKVKAGFIKIAVSDDGPTLLEQRILKAAAIASEQTGAVVASHTADGHVFRRQVKELSKYDFDFTRFIWVHANLETDAVLHLEAAKLGVFVEFDGVGAEWQFQAAMVESTIKMIAAGFIENILLSHDAGWYQPGRPQGEPEGGYRGFADLTEEFIPALISKGVTEDQIRQITHQNPKRAFAFD